MEKKYSDAITELKQAFPKYQDINFSIEDGVLCYVVRGKMVDNMGELQEFVNIALDQKVYRAEYVAFIDVYARNEKEALEFVNYRSPKPTFIRLNKTDLTKTYFNAI